MTNLGILAITLASHYVWIQICSYYISQFLQFYWKQLSCHTMCSFFSNDTSVKSQHKVKKKFSLVVLTHYNWKLISCKKMYLRILSHHCSYHTLYLFSLLFTWQTTPLQLVNQMFQYSLSQQIWTALTVIHWCALKCY